MSRMTTESDVSKRRSRRQWTPHHSSSEIHYEEQCRPQVKLHGSWTTSESFAAPEDLHSFLNDLSDPDVPRSGLMHCCEEISEQLLQIRDELQFDDVATDVIRLRVFGD